MRFLKCKWLLLWRRTPLARRKAVLKHTQSKRWRDVRCGPANAKRLDCARFIAAFSGHAHKCPAARIPVKYAPASVPGSKTKCNYSASLQTSCLKSPSPPIEQPAPQRIAPVTNGKSKNQRNRNRATDESQLAVKKPPTHLCAQNAADNQAAAKVRPEMPPFHVIIAFHACQAKRYIKSS